MEGGLEGLAQENDDEYEAIHNNFMQEKDRKKQELASAAQERDLRTPLDDISPGSKDHSQPRNSFKRASEIKQQEKGLNSIQLSEFEKVLHAQSEMISRMEQIENMVQLINKRVDRLERDFKDVK